LLTKYLRWLQRIVRHSDRPAKGMNLRVVGFRPRIEDLEERTLLASSLLLSGFPTATTAGAVGNLTVTAQQSDGTTDTAYGGTISFSSSDVQAGLPANYTFVAADQGVHTFNVALDTAGTQSLTATDTGSTSITGTESSIAVSPATVSSLAVSGLASPSTAGSAGTVNVTAKDAYGNVATGYTGTVHFSTSDARAGLPSDYTFTAADAGIHSFSVTLKTAGSQSVTATDTHTGSLSGNQSDITVNPAAASSFVVSGFASSITAGTAGTVTVTAQDAYGNVATGYSGTVQVTSSDSQAGLPASYTFVAADAGVHSFSATLKTAGTQALSATDTASTSITGSESGIAVNPASATSLVLSGFPTAVTASVTNTVTITAADPYGNTATGYLGTVHFSSSDAQATLPANYTFNTADAGVHVFSATLATTGTESLTVTDTSTNSVTGTQSSITVRASGSNAWPHPQVVTISFVPDGTVMNSGGTKSNLFSTFNNKWTTSKWENAILTAAQTWAQQANINFQVVSDNGTTSGQGSYQQGDSGMGDIRIGGYSFGNSYLACTYAPPPANNFSIAGDINFNTGQSINMGTTYDLQTIALHEFGHALGLGHASLSTAVMYAYYTGLKTNLSSTDITNIQANYGSRLADAYNSNPQTANTSFSTAASLNTLISQSNLTAVVNNLSINSASQAEYFTFTAPWGTSSNLTVTAQSTGLSMFTPSLTVYAANQSTVLGSASSAVKYNGVTVSTTINNVTFGEQFYIKVTGVDSSAFSTGAFALTLNFGTGSGPTVKLPNTQTANGSPLTGGGGLNLEGLTGGLKLLTSSILATPPVTDYLSPSTDIVPPCCLPHGAGCGCPACRTAAMGGAAAFDSAARQQKDQSEILWIKQAEQNNAVSPTEGWNGLAHQNATGSESNADGGLLFWRDLANAWFGQEVSSEG